MDDNIFVVKDSPTPVFTLEPVQMITLTHPDGREAVIDFSGDAVVYSGELPVEESARIFFECVFERVGR